MSTFFEDFRILKHCSLVFTFLSFKFLCVETPKVRSVFGNYWVWNIKPDKRLEHRIIYWMITQKPLNYAIMQTFIEQSKRHQTEGVFVAWAGKPLLVVYGEDIVKKIVNEPSAIDKPNFYRVGEFFVGKGILTSNGESFKKQQKMAAPAFHNTAVKSYVSIMNKHSEEMVKRLFTIECQPTEDIIDILSECTIGILYETNMGEEENNPHENIQVVNAVKHATELVVERVFCPWLYFDFSLYLFPSTRKVCSLMTDCREKVLKPKFENIKASLISQRETPRKDKTNHQFYGMKPKPFGESFVEQHLQDPSISMDDIVYQTSFIVAAGFDTVVHSLKFSLFLLGLHQDVQDLAREEIMAETKGYINYEDQYRLTYLECVIKESLRLYPVPIFGRYVQKDLQCDKYKIPKNSDVLVFSYMLHRNPEIFPNPEKFLPERFMNENSNIKPWQFVPFAEGIRRCPGKHYAMIQMKIMLAHVLRKFKVISLDRWEDIELKWSIILECTTKLRLQFVSM